MKRLYLLACLYSLTYSAHAQNAERQKLIELGKAYHSFMFSNDPPARTLKDLKADVPPTLKGAAAFISEAIRPKNRLLDKTYLSLPDEQTLHAVYVVEVLFQNLHTDEPKDNIKVADSAIALQVPHEVMVSNYYEMLLNSLLNKNQLSDYFKLNFQFRELGLSNERDAGIFFLELIRHLNSSVWGYYNIAKPMNTKEALRLIRLFPRINDQPYYQYHDFNFGDFLIVTDEKKGPESYKRYYIDKFYELLLFNLIALQKEKAPEKERQDLMLGSILKEKKYYKFTAYKNDLEQLFEEGPLQFNKHFLDCENCWVATAADSTGSYDYGFVYIDETAGPTFHHGGTFRVDEEGALIPVTKDSISLKYRLKPTDSRIAELTESAIKALRLPDMPEWLPVYLKDTGSVKSLYRRGYLYNAWNRSDKALGFLNRAQRLDAHYKGVAMELAYAYNALGQYDKAYTTLLAAPEAKEDACYYYKEFNFAQLKLEKFEAAGSTFKEAAKACSDKTMMAEMAYNIAFEYYAKKDKAGFARWTAELKNWAEPGDQFMNAVAALEMKMQD